MNAKNRFGFGIIFVASMAMFTACGGSDVPIDTDVAVDQLEPDGNMGDLPDTTNPSDIDDVDDDAVPGGPIVAAPTSLNFANVMMGQATTLSLQVLNIGGADLVITSVQPGDVTTDTLEVVDSPTQDVPRVVRRGAQTEFQIRWTPSETNPDPLAAIGYIVIVSNDQASPARIPVYGVALAAMIGVVPDVIDFGFGAQNTPKYATITIRNDGTESLQINSLTIRNDDHPEFAAMFKIVQDTEFSVTNPVDPTPAQIPAGTFREIDLTFTATGPVGGDVSATLIIDSNSWQDGVLEIPMTAKPTVEPVCDVEIVPEKGDFGTVAVGFPKTIAMRLVNTGTGACTIQAYKVADCMVDMGGTVTCPAPLEGAFSQYYEVVTPPPTTHGALLAGKAVSVEVRFTPPLLSNIFNLDGVYPGLLSFQVKDPLTNSTKVVPDCSEACEPNLNAVSKVPKAAVLPDDIDFGVVADGCEARQHKVCLYSVGSGDVDFLAAELSGCSDEFEIDGLPTLPVTVSNSDPVCFKVTYVPSAVGKDSCSLRLSVTDNSSPTVTVPLAGEGVAETPQSDEFVMVGTDPVDILFVIDDSGSMCEEQARLTDALNDFITTAVILGGDYHIGVISVNTQDEAVVGRLNRGDISVVPRFVTPGVNAQAELQDLVALGCDGSSSIEAGLAAAFIALSAPLSTETGLPCDTDADCTGDAALCPDAGNCPFVCVSGECGGFNAGFLRHDSRLEIVMMSDEDDQSPGTVQSYVDLFDGLRGVAGQGRVHFNALVGVPGVPAAGPDEYSACLASDGSTAADCARYIHAVDLTDGVLGSICESSFDAFTGDLGQVVYAPNLQFFLARPADEDTVSVAVDTLGDGNFVTCTDGWEFDATANSVFFVPQGDCVPDAGDHVKVTYDVICII